MSDIAHTSVKNLGVFSILEAGREIKYFLLAINFILLVDNFFIYIHKPGIIALANTPELHISWSLILAVMVAFLFTSSVVLPLLSYFIVQVYIVSSFGLFGWRIYQTNLLIIFYANHQL